MKTIALENLPMRLGTLISRLWRGYLPRRDETELASLNDHLLVDIGRCQQAAERAAERQIRMRLLRLPPY